MMRPMRQVWRDKNAHIWEKMREEYGLDGLIDGRSVGGLERAAGELQMAMDRITKTLPQVTPQGPRFMALCPFHEDHHLGSFFVDARTGWYKCFACDSSGGVFRLMKRLNLPAEDLKLATKGIDFSQLADFIEGPTARSRGGKILPLPESLLDNYNSMRPMRLVNKGHPRRLIDSMEIGVDDRRKRITFPVRRVTGELVAIQTRAIHSDDDRRWKFYRKEILQDLGRELVSEYGLEDYVPPRQSIFFNEHNVLAGMISGYVRKPIVLCEGPGHVLRVIASGFPCLGSFGVSLAEEQLDRLIDALARVKRWSGETARVIIATDGDRPGRMSAYKTTFRIGSRADVRIARIPKGADPEDLTVRELRPLLLGAEPMQAYLMGSGEDSVWANEAMSKHAISVVEAHERADRQKLLREREAQETFLPERNTRPLPTYRVLGRRAVGRKK